MSGEVRGLKAGIYWNKENDASVEVVVNDDGVRIVMADYEVDMFWEFVIDPKTNEVVDSDIGSIIGE